MAAASDLRHALDDCATAWAKAASQPLPQLVYGASGKLAAQIRHGAPFHLFLSADQALPQALFEERLAASPPRPYASGRLVCFSIDADLGRLPLKQLAADARVKRFAFANPEHAPYGQRALEAMHAAGVHERLAPRLVRGENVAQAAQFIASGAAQAGLVSHSLALAPVHAGRGAFTFIPPAWHSPLTQALVLTHAGAAHAAARAFAEWLLEPFAQALLARHGLGAAT